MHSSEKFVQARTRPSLFRTVVGTLSYWLTKSEIGQIATTTRSPFLPCCRWWCGAPRSPLCPRVQGGYRGDRPAAKENARVIHNRQIFSKRCEKRFLNKFVKICRKTDMSHTNNSAIACIVEVSSQNGGELSLVHFKARRIPFAIATCMGTVAETRRESHENP